MPTLLELGLQELYGCWKVIGAEVLKTLSSQLEPWGMRGSHPRPHFIQQAEIAMLNILGNTKGKDACRPSR